MKEIEVHTFDEYRGIVTKYNYHEWIFRGQNNSDYKLESSLYRTIKRNEEIRSKSKAKTIHLKREIYEKEMLEIFQGSSHLFIDKVPDKNEIFDWLSIMQHYGAPTRLLDFSFSPYMALYFAISGASSDAAVFCVNYKKLSKVDELADKDISEKYKNIMRQEKNIKNTILVPFEPKFKNERLFVQQGVFLVPNTLNFSHQDILSEYDTEGNDEIYSKIIIKQECFVEMITELQRMNIKASSVYPGFEGFCKSFETIGILKIDIIRQLPNLLDVWSRK